MKVTCPSCNELYDINWPPEDECDMSDICLICKYSPNKDEAQRMIKSAEALATTGMDT